MTFDGSPCELTTATLAKALAPREISARDALEAHLARISARDARLSAFITVDADGARRQADAYDAARGPTRPLHGVPIAVKDLTNTRGLRTTYGSLLFKDHIPEQDELVVARFRQAGAVIIGKTNTPEFGFGAVCTNRLCGPTRNPFDLALTSGGSSGGSAVGRRNRNGLSRSRHGFWRLRADAGKFLRCRLDPPDPWPNSGARPSARLGYARDTRAFGSHR